MDVENVRNLKENGWIVWLQAEAQVIRDRMEREEKSGRFRPSLTGQSPLEEIQDVLRIRTPLYQQTGDFSVVTDFFSVRETAARILSAMPDGLRR
jgi:shikimate kinase